MRELGLALHDVAAATLPSVHGYTCLGELGRGGHGAVYRAMREATQQVVALKVLHVDPASDAEVRARRRSRFLREVSLCARLQHPHIVGILDFGSDRDHGLFAAFELVPGVTLREELEAQGQLSPSAAVHLLGQVLDALACAHALGIAHRDIKPENIMVSRSGSQANAVVLDFGMASSGDVRAGARITVEDELLGTPAYAAPEQLRALAPTTRSDLYAWALVLAECITGEPAIRGATFAQVVHAQLSAEEVPLPPALLAHPLGSLLRRALRKDPLQRTASAAELHAALKRLHVDDLRLPLAAAGAPHVRETEDGQRAPFAEPSALTWRPIVALCASVDHSEPAWGLAPCELREQLQQALLCTLRDALERLGGRVGGTLAGRLLVLFGEREAGTDDARCAARAALQAMAAVHGELQRATGMGAAFHTRLALHAGLVRARDDRACQGATIDAVLRLHEQTAPDTIRVSAPAAALLRDAPGILCTAASGAPSGERLLHASSLGALRLAPALGAQQRLVGRDPVRVALRHALGPQAHGALAVVIGEAGIGKSALLEAMIDEHLATGRRVLWTRCLPEHQSSALHPMLALLRESWELDAVAPDVVDAALSRHLDALDMREPSVAHVLARWLWLPVREGTPGCDESPQAQQSLVFEVLLAFVHAAPDTVVVVEDVHWADVTTLSFLARAARHPRTRECATRFLLSSRRALTFPGSEAVAASVLQLDALNSDEVRALARRELRRPIADDVLELLLERTSGIPLFVRELLRVLVDEHVLVDVGGVFALSSAAHDLQVPTTLAGTLSERLDRLGDARWTASLAAALGSEFCAQLLGRLAHITPQRLAAQLDVLVREQVLRPLSTLHVGASARYAFRHGLLRDAAYASMLAGDRGRVHGEILALLTTHDAELVTNQPALLAQHAVRAGRHAAAAGYATRAGVLALSRAANVEAEAHARDALRFCQRVAQPARNQAKLRADSVLIQALMALKGWADPEVQQRVAAWRSLLAAVAPEDLELEVATRWALMTYFYVASRRTELARESAAFVSLAERQNDDGLRVAAGTFAGLVLHGRGRYREAGQQFARVCERYDPVAHRHHGQAFGLDSKVWSLSTLALVRWFEGEVEAAWALAEDALAWARTLGHQPSIGIALLYRANLQHYAGDREAVATSSEQLIALDRRYGYPAYAAYGTILGAWAVGDAERATAVCEQLRAMGCTAALSYYASLAAEVHMTRGHFDAARSQLDDCLRLCASYQERYYEAELQRLRGECLFALGDREQAMRAWKAAGARARTSGMKQTQANLRATGRGASMLRRSRAASEGRIHESR